MGVDRIIRPQEKDHVRSKKLCTWSNRFAYAACIFVVIKTLLLYRWDIAEVWEKATIAVSILLTLFAWLLDLAYSHSHYMAEIERKRGLMDNSFGVKMATCESAGYYDTSDITYGVKKLFANIHESCLFTDRIARRMLSKKLILVLISAIIIFICACIGFVKIRIIEPVFDLLLFGLFFKDFLNVLFLCRETKSIEKDARTVWELRKSLGENNVFIARAVFLCIQYECVLARSCIVLDESVYLDMKSQLDLEWSEIRRRYDI